MHRPLDPEHRRRRGRLARALAGRWIRSLLKTELPSSRPAPSPRLNLIFGRWMRHGGLLPRPVSSASSKKAPPASAKTPSPTPPPRPRSPQASYLQRPAPLSIPHPPRIHRAHGPLQHRQRPSHDAAQRQEQQLCPRLLREHNPQPRRNLLLQLHRPRRPARRTRRPPLSLEPLRLRQSQSMSKPIKPQNLPHPPKPKPKKSDGAASAPSSSWTSAQFSKFVILRRAGVPGEWSLLAGVGRRRTCFCFLDHP